MRLLRDGDHTLLVSSVSIWELRIKAMAQARPGLDPSPFTVADAVTFCESSNLAIVSPAPMDYAVPLVPPLDHIDPFDEMLLVHAQQLGARLLTRDARLRAHPLALKG